MSNEPSQAALKRANECINQLSQHPFNTVLVRREIARLIDEHTAELRDRLEKRWIEIVKEEKALRIKESADFRNQNNNLTNENLRLREHTRELVEALEHITKYWNRSENEKAMSDALWHILERAETTLAKHRKEGA